MMESTAYSVIISNEFQSGFTAEHVRDAFAVMFKITPEKAGQLLKGRRVIKKSVDIKSAELYKKKLESIGLIVSLSECNPQPLEAASLSLSSIDNEKQTSMTQPAAGGSSKSGAVVCPKCNNSQPSDVHQCQECGVFIQKLLNKSDAVKSSCSNRADINDKYDYAANGSLTAKSLAVGSVVALLGALVWKLVSSVSGYELGLVAWAIGGAVGFAVISTGSSGLKTGFVCGILALVAILGGKYMIYSGYQDAIVESFASSKNEVRYLYDNEMAAAEAYLDVIDDKSRRQFMVEYDYTEHGDYKDITEEEVQYFLGSDGERLSGYVIIKPSFDEWYQTTFESNLNNLSTMGMIKDDFEFVDAIFFLLGIGTAFRLGRGE